MHTKKNQSNYSGQKYHSRDATQNNHVVSVGHTLIDFARTNARAELKQQEPKKR